jgi:hypothetical protein
MELFVSKQSRSDLVIIKNSSICLSLVTDLHQFIHKYILRQDFIQKRQLDAVDLNKELFNYEIKV